MNKLQISWSSQDLCLRIKCVFRFNSKLKYQLALPQRVRQEEMLLFTLMLIVELHNWYEYRIDLEIFAVRKPMLVRYL